MKTETKVVIGVISLIAVVLIYYKVVPPSFTILSYDANSKSGTYQFGNTQNTFDNSQGIVGVNLVPGRFGWKLQVLTNSNGTTTFNLMDGTEVSKQLAIK